MGCFIQVNTPQHQPTFLIGHTQDVSSVDWCPSDMSTVSVFHSLFDLTLNEKFLLVVCFGSLCETDMDGKGESYLIECCVSACRCYS